MHQSEPYISSCQQISEGEEDPLIWLKQQSGYPKIFWRDRQGREELAAVGALKTIRCTGTFSWQRLRDDLELVFDQFPEARLFGGLAFDPHQKQRGKGWESFGSYWFCLPEKVCVRKNHSYSPSPPQILGRIDGRKDLPEVHRWMQNVARSIGRFKGEELEKVVLARQVTFDLEGVNEPFGMLSNLRVNGQGCFQFSLSPDASGTFFGSSPELLYQREGSSLTTEALAGSRARGAAPEEDLFLKDQLFNCSKERHEHYIVLREIQNALKGCCESVQNSGPLSVVQKSYWQHLYQAIRCTLQPASSDVDILAALHPTPAVCGHPRQSALELIRSLEEFDRGWYAGPVGWISRTRAEFCVGIRCAHFDADALTLFSGAGIVGASMAAKEWKELEMKISPFKKMFSLCL